LNGDQSEKVQILTFNEKKEDMLQQPTHGAKVQQLDHAITNAENMNLIKSF